jgi:predicted aldo/keto reductase-like oxidoreductase
MPCPFGVNIPGCFAAYNDKYLLDGKVNRFKYYQALGFLSKQPAYASICRECRKCESNCPQGIKIRIELKTVSREMEGFFLKNGVKVFRKLRRI